MRVDVSYKRIKKNAVIESTIEKDVQKIERRVKLFKKDSPIHLSLHLEKNPHKEQYFCWTQLYLPFRVLKGHRVNTNICTAINDCTAAILKQLDKVKHKLETHLRKKH